MVRGMQKRIFFLNHSHPEEPISDLKSHKNQFEAEFVVRLVQYFLQQDYEPSQVYLLFLIFSYLLFLFLTYTSNLLTEYKFVMATASFAYILVIDFIV